MWHTRLYRGERAQKGKRNNLLPSSFGRQAILSRSNFWVLAALLKMSQFFFLGVLDIIITSRTKWPVLYAQLTSQMVDVILSGFIIYHRKLVLVNTKISNIFHHACYLLDLASNWFSYELYKGCVSLWLFLRKITYRK